MADVTSPKHFDGLAFGNWKLRFSQLSRNHVFVFPGYSYSYSAAGGTRTRTRCVIFEYEYEYHFIEYEYENASKSTTSKAAGEANEAPPLRLT